MVRHLSCLDHTSLVKTQTRRFNCLCCERSFLPDLPRVRPIRHSSEPFRDSTFTTHQQGACARTPAQSQWTGEATIQGIYKQFIGRKAKERISLNCPAYLGIDEHTLRKGQRFRTTFCEPKNHRIYEVQLGRSGTELTEFLACLQGSEKVRIVCIDLSSTYRKLVRKCSSNTKIVADRFHVARMIYHHCIQLARALVPELKHQRALWLLCARIPSDQLTSSTNVAIDF